MCCGVSSPSAAIISQRWSQAWASQRTSGRGGAPLYARHGIPELWIVDLNANEVHFRSGPRDGAYTAATTTVRGRRALIAFPDVVIDLSLLT